MHSLRSYRQASQTVLRNTPSLRTTQSYGFTLRKGSAARRAGVDSDKPWKRKEKVRRPALLAPLEVQREIRDRIRRIFRAEPADVVEEVVRARLEIWGEVLRGESTMPRTLLNLGQLQARRVVGFPRKEQNS